MEKSSGVPPQAVSSVYLIPCNVVEMNLGQEPPILIPTNAMTYVFLDL
jgi:hypothetical protein